MFSLDYYASLKQEQDCEDHVFDLLHLLRPFYPDICAYYGFVVDEAMLLGLDISFYVKDLYDLLDDVTDYPLVRVMQY